MTSREAKRTLAINLISTDQISTLIEANHYGEAAELLQQAAHVGNGQSHVTQLLTLAHQICLVSTQLREEIERHQQAQDDALRREQQLKEQMRLVLELVVEATREPSLQIMLSSGFPSDDMNRKLTVLAESPKQPNKGDQPIPAATPLLLTPIKPNQLMLYCLGTFEVYQNGELIENWPGRKSTLLFKYFILNRQTPIRKEVLMDFFWPDSDEDAQRNNLNVAIYGLRQALRGGDSSVSHILFQNDCYSLNHELDLWIDYEAFQACCQRGKQLQKTGDEAGAVREFLAAANLYQNDLLYEDRYEEWIEALRHQLQVDYLYILDCLSHYYYQQQDYSACLTICNKILLIEPCFEEAHCRIMRCYCHQGQPYLALRQYDRCAKTLSAELGVPPMSTTERLREQIQNGQWAEMSSNGRRN